MKKLFMGLLFLSACMEVAVPNVDMSINQSDLSSTTRDLATIPFELDFSVVPIQDLGNLDLSTPYEILCPLDCCKTGLLLKYADRSTCLFPATAHLDHVGQSCDGGYLSIFVWCY